MAKSMKKKPPFPPIYRVVDPETHLAVFVSEDIDETKKEAIRRRLPMEAYEPGYYEDEWHPNGMWFLIHYDYRSELPQS